MLLYDSQFQCLLDSTSLKSFVVDFRPLHSNQMLCISGHFTQIKCCAFQATSLKSIVVHFRPMHMPKMQQTTIVHIIMKNAGFE
jgi:hypothetical protein